MLTYPAVVQGTQSSKTSVEMISVVAAAIVAAAAAWVMAYPSGSAQIEAAASQTSTVKTDRVDNRAPAVACSDQAWPYYERGCLRDRSESAVEMRTVRIVPIDRMLFPNPIAIVAK